MHNMLILRLHLLFSEVFCKIYTILKRIVFLYFFKITTIYFNARFMCKTIHLTFKSYTREARLFLDVILNSDML